LNDLKKFRRSFRYAYEGLKYALSTQQNLQFHVAVAFLVLLLGIVVKLPKLETLFLFLSITMVIAAELVNTAIEKAVDLVTSDFHPLAKIAKDTAAAAVLVTALFAVIVGTIVFYEPIERMLREGSVAVSAWMPGVIWAVLALVALAAVVADARLGAGKRSYSPNMLTAVAFSLATWISLLTSAALVALLGFGLSALLTLILYDKHKRSFPSLMIGGVAGSGLTVLAYYLIRFV